MSDLTVFSMQPVRLSLHGCIHWLVYLVHNAGGPDRLLLDSNGRLVVGKDLAALEAAIGSLGYSTDEQFADAGGIDTLISLDALSPMPRIPLDPATATRLWDGWSMLDDLCLTIGRPLGFRGRIARAVLDKLFWGMNLAVAMSQDETFTPTLSAKERAKWDQIIATGLERIEPALHTTSVPELR